MILAYWILFGIIIGAIASLVTPTPRSVSSVLVTIVLGSLGALAGGFVGRALGLYSRTGAPGALAMAILGAVVLLAVYHAMFARRQLY